MHTTIHGLYYNLSRVPTVPDSEVIPRNCSYACLIHPLSRLMPFYTVCGACRLSTNISHGADNMADFSAWLGVHFKKGVTLVFYFYSESRHCILAIFPRKKIFIKKVRPQQ